MSYKNENQDQARIRRSFANSPYGGMANMNYTGEMDYKTIADNLEKLLPIVESASKKDRAREQELNQIKSDLAGMGRLIKLASNF